MKAAIYKSSQDPRHYQAIRLDNSMTVLLVSGKEAVKSLAAVAMTRWGRLKIRTISLAWRRYMELEHIILMGLRHYLEPENLSEFLKKHDGDHNASTVSYRTAFYLEVENDALQPVGCRLAKRYHRITAGSGLRR